MSLINELGDALVTVLSELTEQPVSRNYNPQIELSKLGELRIFVVPSEINRKAAARGIDELTLTLAVVVIKKLKSDANEEIDSVMELVEKISRHASALSLDVRGGAKCTAVENRPLYVESWINQNRQFTSRIILTFTLFERKP